MRLCVNHKRFLCFFLICSLHNGYFEGFYCNDIYIFLSNAFCALQLECVRVKDEKKKNIVDILDFKLIRLIVISVHTAVSCVYAIAMRTEGDGLTNAE